MVSRSKDGDMLSAVFAALGWRTVRGSSGRGGAQALMAATQGLISGEHRRMCMAVDGSRGPRYIAKIGSLSLVSNSGSWLICAQPRRQSRMGFAQNLGSHHYPQTLGAHFHRHFAHSPAAGAQHRSGGIAQGEIPGPFGGAITARR